jgi:CheY-like chemotaxis protein
MQMPIVALVSDLIFGSKISATAGALGLDVEIVRTADAAIPKWPAASALIIDLNADLVDGAALIRTLRAARPDGRIIAFCAHVQTELMAAARAAGADEVLPRSKFNAKLADLLQRLSPSA